MRIVVFLFLLLYSAFAHADPAKTDLMVVSGTKQSVLTREKLQSLHLSTVEVNDPVYHRSKLYAGYWLLDVLDVAGIHPDDNSVLTFTALDGYKAQIAFKDIEKSKSKGLIAVKDFGAPEGWEKIQHGKELVSPAPYYLVWENATDTAKLPWPYQMVEISVRQANEIQQKILPDGDKTEAVTRGYEIFKQSCLACHSLNLEGGTLGPELNVPKNILEYTDRGFLKEFIGNPSSFRARSKMPNFNSTLSSQSIDDVLDYLAWMGKHKIQE